MISRLGYDVGMKARLKFALSCVLPVAVWAQPRTRTPRFEDYPVSESFQGTPATPNLVSLKNGGFRTVIREGVAKRHRVVDQPGGKENRAELCRALFYCYMGLRVALFDGGNR